MKLAVVCDEKLKNAFLSKKIKGNIDSCFVSSPEHIPPNASVIIDLLFANSPERISLLKPFLPRPVFINSVVDTLASIGQPFIRINAWPTFFTREIIELTVWPPQQALVKDTLDKMEWPYIVAPDIVGLISPRIIAGIINEAYFALEEKVSSREEIDTAMKAGTHYPFGPFEWSRLIGLKKIYDMLRLLYGENGRAEISVLLIQEALSDEIKKIQV